MKMDSNYKQSGIMAGNVNVNFVPFPSNEETLMSPPSALAMFLLIHKPKPTPSWFISRFLIVLLNV